MRSGFQSFYADDYHENLQMAVDLLYHALTGDFLKIKRRRTLKIEANFRIELI
jgi:hypothetical protein